MKFVLLVMTTVAFAQSPKSIETPASAELSEQQEEQAEIQEERKARINWDREEAAAQAQEERRRILDEESEQQEQ